MGNEERRAHMVSEGDGLTAFGRWGKKKRSLIVRLISTSRERHNRYALWMTSSPPYLGGKEFSKEGS